jgi:GTP cyclohydrolase IA
MEMQDVESAIRQIIEHYDDNPDREGLKDTPARFNRFLDEFLETKPFSVTTFDANGYDEMVVASHIPFFGICEHHLVPFFGEGTIAYLPDKKLVGLSKLARTLEHFSHRFQMQERITMQVADYLVDTLHPKGVGVTLEARHLCLEMRGIKTPGVRTTTTCLKGLFKSNQATRAEFLNLVK